jgi:hypothetical protein
MEFRLDTWARPMVGLLTRRRPDGYVHTATGHLG